MNCATIEAVRSAVLPVLGALCGAFLVDALGVVSRGSSQGALWSVGRCLTTLGYGLSLGLLPALALDQVLGWLWRSGSDAGRGDLPRFALTLHAQVRRRDFLCLVVLLLSVGVASFYWLGLRFASLFHNRELTALLLACLIVTYLLLAFLLVNRVAPVLSRLRTRAVLAANLLVGFALSCSLAVTSLVLVDNRTGFAQLDPWLGYGGLACVAGYVVFSLAGRGRTEPVWASRAAWAAGAASFVVGAFLSGEVVAGVAEHGSLSRYLLSGLRQAVDWDRDGYAALWGGGDCDGFDSQVHPGAVEVPGDGLDNNCFGGDAKTVESASPPRWSHVSNAVPARPNLLLITVETLRADAVGFLVGSRREGQRYPSTRNLDALAKRSVVFENFFATTPWTRLSLPAIFVSRPPTHISGSAAKKFGHRAPVGAGVPWLPEVLRDSGYRTVAVLNSFAAFTKKESLGFERGFDVYDTSTRLSYIGGTMRGHIGRAQARLVMHQLEKEKRRPFFIWLHLMEPHYLYERSARAPNFGDAPEDLYASEVWEADAVIGEILNRLRRLGLEDKTIVAVVGDHAEEFGEHGDRWHGTSLMQTQIHTPFLMHVPGLSAARIGTAVTHTDLAPTLLNLMRVRRSFDRWRGRNLTHLVNGERLERDYFLLERYELHNGRRYMAAIVHYPFKLIYREEGNDFQLYDLVKDPSERHMATRKGPAYETLEQLLRQHVDGAGQ